MSTMQIKQLFRHLSRKKFYTGINLLGLGIGLGCVILMSTYLIHEFSYDRYHQKSNRIFRLIDGNNCKTAYAMGDAFMYKIPGIEGICRILNLDEVEVKLDGQFIKEKNIMFADSTLFNIFDFNLVSGRLKQSLTMPNTLLISQRAAEKYFPNDNAVGQPLDVAIGQQIRHFQVAGVFRDLPSNSSLQTNLIAGIDNAFPSLMDITYMVGVSNNRDVVSFRQKWNRNDFSTFVLLHPNVNVKDVETKMSDIGLLHREVNPEGGIVLQPISQMYLHSGEYSNSDVFGSNQLGSLKIFMGIGILILLVAVINFILISNADNRLSIKEIACQKVNGASKNQILLNSISKTLVTAYISLIPAILFAWLTMPFFNNLFQKELSITMFLQAKYLLALLVTTTLTGVAAGLYLGIYVSSVNPAALFQSRLALTYKRQFFKEALVIVQFTIFILLTASFLFMNIQYNFTLHKDLGLTTSNLIAVNINGGEMKKNVDYLKNEIKTDPNVLDCLPTSFTIPPSNNQINFEYRDPKTNQGVEQEALVVGAGIIEMLKIPLVEGRTYNSTDNGFGQKFILNEAAAQKYKVHAGDKVGPFEVIGIVKNFHFHSLHRPVEPVFIGLQSQNYPYLLVKTNGKNAEVINHIRQTCQTIAPDYYLDYQLLDDRIANFYSKEEKQMGTIGFFSLIALLLSSMGLLGFVALSLVKRTKEIGIRKINGASIAELVKAINLQYVKSVAIAITIATPIVYYAMHKWLENFAYKTDLSWWIFALAGLLALGIALLTVSWQSWRAATRNPVEALRYE